MERISLGEFSKDGNPMTAVSAQRREFYKSGEELGVVAVRESGRKQASILRDSDYFARKRTDETKFFNSRKDISDAREWLVDNIE